MQIAGLQKFSLSDYPGQPAAVVFARGCNLRCPWCHNSSLVYPERYAPLIPEEEVISFLESRRGKLKAVVVSGGEPTLQPDLLEFLRKLKEMGYLVKLDTNGTMPGVIEDALKAGLIDCFAVDYKLDLEQYPALLETKKDGGYIICSVETSIRLAVADGRGYIRTTLVPEADLVNMERRLRELLEANVSPGSAKWKLQAFIERKN